jgi:hypothetical protein
MRRLILGTIGAAAICAIGAPASQASPLHVVRTIYQNIDRDSHIERVQVMATTRPNPFGGTAPLPVRWVQVRDRIGSRRVTVRVSLQVEHLPARKVKVVDTTADGIPEIWWHGSTGDTAGAPVYGGLVHWSGSAKHVLWHYRPDQFVGIHNGRKFYYDFAKFALQNMPSAHTPGLEIVQRVYARTASEPLCCPTWEKLSLFRYDDGINRYVRYDLEWIKL